uniref:Uncharacterized protein n=1 Tax=Arundo donax TaxID=35708 RepID=A0A0A9AKQ1_ARUDO
MEMEADRKCARATAVLGQRGGCRRLAPRGARGAAALRRPTALARCYSTACSPPRKRTSGTQPWAMSSRRLC